MITQIVILAQHKHQQLQLQQHWRVTNKRLNDHLKLTCVQTFCNGRGVDVEAVAEGTAYVGVELRETE